MNMKQKGLDDSKASYGELILDCSWEVWFELFSSSCSKAGRAESPTPRRTWEAMSYATQERCEGVWEMAPVALHPLGFQEDHRVFP